MVICYICGITAFPLGTLCFLCNLNLSGWICVGQNFHLLSVGPRHYFRILWHFFPKLLRVWESAHWMLGKILNKHKWSNSVYKQGYCHVMYEKNPFPVFMSKAFHLQKKGKDAAVCTKKRGLKRLIEYMVALCWCSASNSLLWLIKDCWWRKMQVDELHTMIDLVFNPILLHSFLWEGLLQHTSIRDRLWPAAVQLREDWNHFEIWRKIQL